MKLFSGYVMGKKEGQVSMQVIAVTAENSESANDMGMDLARKSYPLHRGYFSHEVWIMEISQGMIDKCATKGFAQ